MKKAVIVYQSKTGITKKFGKEINGFLAGKGIETHLVSVNEYKRGLAEQADYLLLGCWTAGFMLLFQHPDAIWKQFAIGLPTMPGKKIGLFTTYKIATGSMFKSMKKALGNTGSVPMVELKSRKGNLTEEGKVALEQFLSN